MVHLLSNFFIQKRRENSNRFKLWVWWYEVILTLSHSSFYPKFCLWAEAETRQKLLHIFLRIREQQSLHLKFFDFIANLSIYWLLENWNDWYRKVVSSWLSWLVAHPSIFKLFMKGKFDAYLLWPLAQRVQNWIVDRSTARYFTVSFLSSHCLAWEAN